MPPVPMRQRQGTSLWRRPKSPRRLLFHEIAFFVSQKPNELPNEFACPGGSKKSSTTGFNTPHSFPEEFHRRQKPRGHPLCADRHRINVIPRIVNPAAPR